MKHTEINYLTKPGLLKIAEDHWKTYLPTMYQAMKQTNELEQSLIRSVNLTYEAMQKVIKFQMEKNNLTQQMAETIAWEIYREMWILKEPEGMEEDQGEFQDIETGLRKIQTEINNL